MIQAFLWGALAASSLLIGALIAFGRPPGKRLLGLIMGFGSGVLLSAVSFELVAEGVDIAQGAGAVALGLFAGAAAFTGGDVLIGRFERRRQQESSSETTEASGLSIVLGALLDGVPETAVLGLTLLQTGQVGAAMLAAVFVSNIPEGVAASATLIQSGWKKTSILWLWTTIVLASALAAAIGYVALDGAAPTTLGFIYAFAAGAILTMLATSMMPEAYERAGRLVGFVTVFGFVVAFAIHILEG